MSNLVLRLLLKSKDDMSGAINSAVQKSAKNFDKLRERIDKTSKTLSDIGRKSILAGAAISAPFVVGVKLASDFEKGMSNVSTLIDTNSESMELMKKQTLDIFKTVPVTMEDTTSALYSIRSAGIEAGDAMNVLERSAKLGIAGLGSTAEAVDLVTSSINAFNLKGEEQNRIYDVIFKAVKTGKTNISELAQGFGAVAGTVSAAGIKVDEYIASVAAITTVGNPASQAHTQIKAAIAGLTRGTKDQQAIFRQLQAKDFNDLIQKSGGMVGAFQKINSVVKGNKSTLISLLGSIEAYNAFLGLTGGQNKAFVDTLNSMRDGTNAVDEAYQKQSQTLALQTQRFTNLVQTVSIQFGDALLPLFARFVDTASKITEWFTNLPAGVKSTIAITTISLSGLLISFGGIALVASGAISALGSYLKIIRAIGPYMPIITNSFKAAMLAVRSFNITLLANPISWIAIAIASAAFLIYKYWKPISAFFRGLWQGIVEATKPLQPIFTKMVQHFQPVLNIVKSVYNWFKEFLKPVNSAGKASENLGLTIGKAIGSAITLVVKLIDKFKLLNPMIAAYKAFQLTKGIVNDLNLKNNSKVNGSHASGLARVPFDGYIAELHEGERVLTKEENTAFSGLKGVNSSINLTYAPVIHADSQTDIRTIKQILEEHERKLLEKLKTEQRRQEARAYA